MTYTAQDREDRVQYLISRLRETDGRATPQRVAVIRALVGSDRHPSVDDVYRELRPTFPTMSEATVYKTIDRLKRMGEILELEFNERGNRYDTMKPAPHVHLICLGCGKISDAELDLPLDTARHVAQQAGFRMADVRFDVHGWCETCRAPA